MDSFRQMWDKHCKKVPKLFLLFMLSVCQHLGSFISIRVTERNKTKCTFSFLAVRKEIMLTWIGLALQTEHVLGCVLCFSLSAPSVAAVSTWSRCQLGANRSFQTLTVPSFIHKKHLTLEWFPLPRTLVIVFWAWWHCICIMSAYAALPNLLLAAIVYFLQSVFFGRESFWPLGGCICTWSCRFLVDSNLVKVMWTLGPAFRDNWCCEKSDHMSNSVL